MLYKKINTSWNQGSVCRVYSYSNYIIALVWPPHICKIHNCSWKNTAFSAAFKRGYNPGSLIQPNTQWRQRAFRYSRSPSFSSWPDLPFNDSDHSGSLISKRLIFYVLQDEDRTNSFLFHLDIMELWDASPEQAGSQSHGKIHLALPTRCVFHTLSLYSFTGQIWFFSTSSPLGLDANQHIPPNDGLLS